MYKKEAKDPTSVDVKVSELQSKIATLETENKLLKESCSNKQKLLEAVLEHNSVLIKEKSKDVVNPNDKQVSLNKSTCDSQNHMGLDKSNHGTIIQTGITCKKILYKSLLNSAWL